MKTLPPPPHISEHLRAATSASPRRRVLVAIHSNTFFVELFRTAKLVKASSDFDIGVLFGWPYPTQARDVAACRSEGIDCLGEDGGTIPEPAAIDAARTPSDAATTVARPRLSIPYRAWLKILALKNRAIQELPDLLPDDVRVWLRRCKIFWAKSQPAFLAWHVRRREFAERVLSNRRIDLLVLGGDMPGYDTSDFIAAAHHLDIPVALVPSTMSNGLEQAEAYFHNPQFQLESRENRGAARRYPRWVREHRGRKLLRRPGGDILAMEELGTAPPHPWGFNSGFADVVCAESQEMIDYYLDCGLPREQIVDTGSPANDVLAEYAATAPQRRSELLRELGLVDDRPLIVAALPPDFLYLDGGRPECDFRKYDDLVAFWHRSLTSLGHCNVLLSLHPSVSPEAFRHLETDNLRIGPGNTASLVPLADVYVASVSSTIRWAIACGKPVINYDVYRYRYTDYLHVPGVATMEEQVEFVAELDRMANDVEYRRKRTLQQQSVADRWGRLDGLAGRRLLELFRKLTTPSAADVASRQGEAAVKRSA